jgi:hypothetical protein
VESVQNVFHHVVINIRKLLFRLAACHTSTVFWNVYWWIWPKIYCLELLRTSESTLSHWSWLHFQPLAPTNPHWTHLVGYGPFSLCVIHKEGLCPSSGDINRLKMMMMMNDERAIRNQNQIAEDTEKYFIVKLICRNPRWTRVVIYGPFSLSAIHKESLCLSSGDINRLMMMVICRTLMLGQGLIGLHAVTYIHTYKYIPLTLDPRRGSRSVSNFPPRRLCFTKMT